MSRLVASLHSILETSHCIDIGGGRGHLPTVLALGYNIPSLTVDCDVVALKSGEKRDRLIQVSLLRDIYCKILLKYIGSLCRDFSAYNEADIRGN